MAWRVEVKGGKALEKALAMAGKRAPQAMAQALSIEAESIMTESKKLAPVDEGTLRDLSSTVHDPVHGPGTVSVTMGYGGPASDYALYVHEGIGPAVGRPPFRVSAKHSKDWARRVLGDEDAAYAVAAAVGKRGLKPTKFLETPFRAARAGMSARLARRIRTFMNWQE